jgi:hydrogenase-4 component E
VNPVFNLLSFFTIVLALFMQWQIYVTRTVVTFAVSSILIAAALVYSGVVHGTTPVIVLGGLTAVVRAVVIPVLLVRSLHVRPHRAREHSPAIPTALSILISLALVLFAYGIYNFALLDYLVIPNGFLPIALLLQGAFLIASKRNAYSQIIGYLVMENAVLLLGSLVLPGLPFIVEAGVILDLLGIVAVSRIIIRVRESAVEENGYHNEELRG